MLRQFERAWAYRHAETRNLPSRTYRLGTRFRHFVQTSHRLCWLLIPFLCKMKVVKDLGQIVRLSVFTFSACRQDSALKQPPGLEQRLGSRWLSWAETGLSSKLR